MEENHDHGSFVGRAAECAALRGLVERAVAGEGGSVVVVGPPGIGKSALLQYVADTARDDGHAVVHVVGTEAEREWPYAGLNLILSGSRMATRDEWTETASRAETRVRRAMDHASVYEVALEAQRLTEQATTPVIVVVDDAHLLDEPSRDVIAFVARRVRSVPVALLISTSLSARDTLPFSGLRTMHLSELSAAETARLVKADAEHPVADAVAEHIARSVGGNPRAVLDVVERTPPGQLEGHVEPDRYLPQSDVLAQLFLPDLDLLGEEQRFALLVAAVSVDGRFSPVMDAVAGRGDRLVTWLAQRHLAVSEGSFSFRRPAVRSVIWHAASLAERSQAHLALARAYADADPELELWHRAQGEEKYDDTLAADLQRAAEEARLRGAFERSADFARQSVRLAGDTAERIDSLILSGQLALHRGRPADAVRIAGERRHYEVSPEQGADLVYLEAYARFLDIGYVGTGIITRQAQEVAQADPNRAARLYLLAARQFATRMALTDAGRFLRFAEQYAAAFDEATSTFHRSLRAWLAAMSGEPESAVALVDPDAVPRAGAFDDADVLLGNASALMYAERYDAARGVLHNITQAQAHGDAPALIGAAYAIQTALELRAGRIVAARNAARACARAMPQTWSRTGRVAAHMIRVHALLGEIDEAWDSHRQAAACAQRTNEWGTAGLLQAETGFLLLLHNRVEEAIPVLERARRYALEYREPALLLTEPDFIEACVRHGDLEWAAKALSEFESRVRECPSAWALAALARCRALVAEGTDALTLFHEAVDAHTEAVSPLELARTQLCFGERLRRVGRKVDARVWLDRAVVLFHECGATAYAARAEQELSGHGWGPARTAPGEQTLLTSAERKVAAMAASGMRNREIAAELFVSTRTVEGHLSQVFRKLGIRSRTELAGVLAHNPGLRDVAGQ